LLEEAMVYPGTNLQARIKVIRWIIPIGLLILSIGYQFGPARWIHDNVGDEAHFLIEIFFYGLVGPSIVYLAFNKIQQWLLEKEQAENVARTTQLKLASITEASADAIIGLTSDGIIESWNRGAEQLLGYLKNEITDLSFLTLIGGKENSHVEWDWLSETVQKSGFIRGYETNLRRANDDLVVVELTATHMSDENGMPTGYSMILRDITERKNSEAEIHQLNTRLNDLVQIRTQELDEKVDELANANEQLKKLDETRSEFVSLVSHQIRAPLTNIRGAVEKMQLDRQEISDESIRLLNIIDQQAERLNRLVRDVLHTNQIETGQLILQKEALSILPLIEQSVEQLHSRSQKRIDIPVKHGLPMVYSDSDRVIEVITNLLDNAMKYSPHESEIHIDAHANQSGITVSIRDFGEGIAAQELPKIFEKFYRSDSSDSQKAYGYGLGLYICRRLIEAMDGKIWAENHPEGGAVVSFTLPVWQEIHD
jgi:PAS domain S-box-containing protein